MFIYVISVIFIPSTR